MGPKCVQSGTKMDPSWVPNGIPRADGTCPAPVRHWDPKKCDFCETIVKTDSGTAGGTSFRHRAVPDFGTPEEF